MKSRFTLLFTLVMACIVTMGQRSVIELSFTAVDSAAYVQLDSIRIMNRTQGGDTVLYWPDTVLNYPLGFTDLYKKITGFQLYQSYPNPVEDQTTFNLSIPEQGQVNLMVTDMLGRIVYNWDMVFTAGQHTLLFTPGKETLYCLSSTWEGIRKSIKILHNGPGDAHGCSLVYVGSTSLEPEKKSQTSGRALIISPGDTLLYIGYGATLQSGILDTPEESKTYTFQFATNIPCPGRPTVEYKGQVYTSIQNFSQCWLKENLNVGEIINGSIEQSNNGITEKYCYNNEPDSCIKYGGLYQWGEMMQYTTQQGVQGICPPGWHLPTDEEWKVLEGAVDSQYGIGDNTWDISGGYRGYDVGTNLKTTSGWYENGNGSDLFGFSGLPGGVRAFDGYFYYVGQIGLWWSSSESDYDSAWDRDLDCEYSFMDRGKGGKEGGFSVRCLRDY